MIFSLAIHVFNVFKNSWHKRSNYDNTCSNLAQFAAVRFFTDSWNQLGLYRSICTHTYLCQAWHISFVANYKSVDAIYKISCRYDIILPIFLAGDLYILYIYIYLTCIYIYICISTDGNFAHLCVNILFSFSLLAHKNIFNICSFTKKRKIASALLFVFLFYILYFFFNFAFDLLLAVT